MEHIIKDKMMEYLNNNHLLCQHQHGFLPGKSTLTNLLESKNDCASSLDENKSVDIVYIDIRKAFDSVVVDKLIYKVKKKDFDNDILT